MTVAFASSNPLDTPSLPQTTLPTPNKGQKAAAEAFMEFLLSDDKEFIISGPAGVGKTFLMSHLIDTTIPRYEELCKLIGSDPIFNSVQMTATTNKAADVLSKSVGRPTGTVHSAFNLTVKDDYSTGKSVIRKTKRWEVHHNKVFFIDECSMIDTELYKALHEGTINCKLVYVGDHHQLAPVTEDLSPVYKHSARMVELTEPVRNAGNPALMAICQQLRDTVATGEFLPIHIVPGSIDYLDGPQAQAEIDRLFAQQTHAARILAYTNKQVLAYNDYIRSMRNLPSRFQAGEFLVTNSVLHHSKGHVAVEMELEVLKNHGASRLLVDEEHDVYLDIDRIDIKDSFGVSLRDIPVMTNRIHFDELIKYYGRAKNWTQYFALKNNVADLRPRDAATVHKSQGSTYETVFIDLANISTCHQPQQVARMLYVAFSRASSRVILHGELAAKYGGLIHP